MPALAENQTPAATAEAPVARHSAGVRWLHWSLAACYVLAIATGFTLYWEKLLGWLKPYWGGNNQTIYIHFWAGIGLALFTFVLGLVWRQVARWTPADTQFVRDLPSHARHPGRPQPEDTGFFNGGQKLYFWAVIWSCVLFLITGTVWCFRYQVPHNVYAVCRTTHRVLGVIMLIGLVVHIYKASIGEPGTLRSMIRGTVTAQWARARRPQWWREVKKD